MRKSSKHPTEKSKKHADIDSTLLAELPFEDKLWLFWGKYNRAIMLGIAIVILAFIGYQGFDFYKMSQIENLQSEYRIALEEGHALVFADNNVKEPLAGSIFLSTADGLVKNSKYEEAIVNYNKALVSLKSTPFADRAALGIALVTWMKDDQDGAKKLLKELVNNNKVMGAVRAEAAYQLALINLKEGDYTKSKELLDSIHRIPNAGIWGQKASILRDSTPGLSTKV